MKISKLNGMNVINAEAYTLGEAGRRPRGHKHVDHSPRGRGFNKRSSGGPWIKKPMLGALTVCLPVNAVKKVGYVITLNKSIGELKNLKECKV